VGSDGSLCVPRIMNNDGLLYEPQVVDDDGSLCEPQVVDHCLTLRLWMVMDYCLNLGLNSDGSLYELYGYKWQLQTAYREGVMVLKCTVQNKGANYKSQSHYKYSNIDKFDSRYEC